MAAEEGLVTRDSLFVTRLVPIASPIALPAPARLWSEDDWTRIRAGHFAFDMDDKWNAFVERDRLFLHRSWTGMGIYEALFTRIERRWRIAQAIVENDPTGYRRGSDEVESLCLELIIESMLLRRFRQREWRRWHAMLARDLATARVPPGKLSVTIASIRA